MKIRQLLIGTALSALIGCQNNTQKKEIDDKTFGSTSEECEQEVTTKLRELKLTPQANKVKEVCAEEGLRFLCKEYAGNVATRSYLMFTEGYDPWRIANDYCQTVRMGELIQQPKESISNLVCSSELNYDQILFGDKKYFKLNPEHAKKDYEYQRVKVK